MKILKGCLMAVGGFFVLIIGIAAIANFQDAPTTAPTSSSTPKTPDKTVTLAAYEKITAGMTYDEVVQLAGFEGTSMSVVEIEGVPKTEVFMWQNTFGSNMNVTFQDGKMVSKAQFGLK